MYSIEIDNDNPVDFSTIIIDKDCIVDNLQTKGKHTELITKGQQNNQKNRNNIVINSSLMSNLDKLIFDEIQKTDGTTISLDTLQEKYFKSIYQNSYEFTQDVYNYIGKI